MQPKDKNSTLDFITSNFGVASFLTKTVLLAIALVFVYHFLWIESSAYNYYMKSLTLYSSDLLKFTGVEHELQKYLATQYSDMIAIPRTHVRILVSKEFDGLISLAIMVAAIVNWPGNWVARLMVLTAGCGLVILSAICRIAITTGIDHYAPLSYTLFAEWLIPITTLFFIPFLIFLFWVKVSGRHPAE